VKRSGTADLPLHGGHVPPWLANRMTELGTAIRPEADKSVPLNLAILPTNLTIARFKPWAELCWRYPMKQS